MSVRTSCISTDFKNLILWRIDPFLSGDSVNMTVATQRLGKHVPVARQQIINNATGGRNNRRAVFSL
jgi:hypothetical protein